MPGMTTIIGGTAAVAISRSSVAASRPPSSQSTRAAEAMQEEEHGVARVAGHRRRAGRSNRGCRAPGQRWAGQAAPHVAGRGERPAQEQQTQRSEQSASRHGPAVASGSVRGQPGAGTCTQRCVRTRGSRLTAGRVTSATSGGSHARAVLARQERHPLRHRARPEDRGAARRDRQGHELRHLRLGPAPLRRLHARHGVRRHHGPRVHGRGRRGRAGEQEAQGRRPGVVPFTIICGECEQCRRGNFSVCERTNRNKDVADKLFGHTTAGLFGYTHLTGGYPGGQAEYVRVPFADAPVKVPSSAQRRAGAVPRRHLPDRLAGGGRSATSSRPTRWRSGAAARSGSSRSAAPFCWARSR